MALLPRQQEIYSKIGSLRRQINMDSLSIDMINENIRKLELMRKTHSDNIEKLLNEIQELDEEKEGIFIEYLKQHPEIKI